MARASKEFSLAQKSLNKFDMRSSANRIDEEVSREEAKETRETNMSKRDPEDTCDVLLKNSYVSEMALRNLRDFKSRSRSNVVPRVAKRINMHERRFKDKHSTMTSVAAADTKRSKANSSVTA